MKSVCAQCGTLLRSEVLGGLCPHCLGAMALGAGGLLEVSGGDSESVEVGDYDLIREVGRGGMGVVYEAVQRSLNRRVALKMLSGLGMGEGRERLKARLRREAESAARLSHPGIVAVYEVGERDGQPFFVMELIEGPSLAALTRDGPMEPRRAARMLSEVAEAVEHAHRCGVLHRDLKPSNVLVDPDGRPRVTDFGLAKQLEEGDQELTRSGEVLGSPGYVAPEVLAGMTATRASDVHALGGLLYHLLTGRPPFVGATVAATLEQVRTSDPVSPRLLNPGVPKDLETICLKALRREPHRRYGSAAELASDLKRFGRGEPVLARPVSRWERMWMWCCRRPGVAVLLMALSLAVVGGVMGVVWQWHRAERSRESMERHLYAADMAAASVALRDGNLGRARELLLQHAPSSVVELGSRGTGTVTGRGGGSGSGGAGVWSAGAGAADLREFTWRLLWSRCQSMEWETMGEHPWIVTRVVISGDGKWAASGGMDLAGQKQEVLKLWGLGKRGGGGLGDGSGAEEGEVVERDLQRDRTLPEMRTVWSLEFTADNKTLVSAGVGGVRFWDVETGVERVKEKSMPMAQEIALGGEQLVGSPNHPFMNGEELKPLWHCEWASGKVKELGVRGRHPALTRDGRWLAYVDGGMGVKLFDLRRGEEVMTLATNRMLFRLQFSPEGRRLLGAGLGTTVRVWDLPLDGAGELRKGVGVGGPVMIAHDHNVWDAQFIAEREGGGVLVGTSDQKIQRWSGDGKELLGTWLGHENEVWALAVSGGVMLSGGKDRTVRRWPMKVVTGTLEVGNWRYVTPSFDGSGDRLLVYERTNGVGGAVVWGMSKGGGKTMKRLGEMSGYPRGFAPEGGDVLFWDEASQSLEWRTPGSVVGSGSGGEVSRRVPLKEAGGKIWASEMRVSGDLNWVIAPVSDGSFGRWSTRDGRRGGRWEDEAMAQWIRSGGGDQGKSGRLYRSIEVSRGGRWVAMNSSQDSGVILVDLEGGKMRKLLGHRDDVTALAFGRGDTSLASGSVDGSIRLWDVESGEGRGLLLGHLESVEAVAFSGDGETLASANPGIEVRFWHVATLRQLAAIPASEVGHSLVFSPEGERLAVGMNGEGGGKSVDRVEIWRAPRPDQVR